MLWRLHSRRLGGWATRTVAELTNVRRYLVLIECLSSDKLIRVRGLWREDIAFAFVLF